MLTNSNKKIFYKSSNKEGQYSTQNFTNSKEMIIHGALKLNENWVY